MYTTAIFQPAYCSGLNSDIIGSPEGRTFGDCFSTVGSSVAQPTAFSTAAN